jgi:nitrite reductase/ring-hydroxylating ferredoxin subunit
MPCERGHLLVEDIVCPGHRSCFNIKTGRVTSDPAMEDVATYKVHLAGVTRRT